MKKDCILFYGPYAAERIKTERGLLSLAVPASKRMHRITESIRLEGRSACIVAPGISFSARIPFAKGHHFALRDRGIPVLVVGQVGIRFFAFLLSPLMAVIALFRIAKRHRLKAVFQYCYYPDAVLFSAAAKVFLGSKIVLDLEDICIPALSDWKRNSETRPFQQIWGYALMKLSIRLADVVIIPTKRFKPFVGVKGAVLTVSGCQNVSLENPMERQQTRIGVLYGGAFVFEHGVDLLADALVKLDGIPNAGMLEVHMCGRGDKWDWFRERIKDIRNIRIYCHGYVSNEEFVRIYERIDVCCVLQRPSGRHSLYKTPSKGYEALCSGKTIIVSDIGDFGELPDEICYKLSDYSIDGLVAVLKGLSLHEIRRKQKAAQCYAQENWSLGVVAEKFKNAGVL